MWSRLSIRSAAAATATLRRYPPPLPLLRRRSVGTMPSPPGFVLPPPTDRVAPLLAPTVWLEFTPLAAAVGAINLGQGAPSWPPPAFVTTAAADAAQDARFAQYAPPRGSRVLLDALSSTYTPSLGAAVSGIPTGVVGRDHIVVTVGATQAVQLVLAAFVPPGGEVLLIDPAFDVYDGAVAMAGGVTRRVPLRPMRADGAGERPRGLPVSSRQFGLDMTELRAALSPRTAVVILNTPHNPTGKVFTADELRAIAAAIDDVAPSAVVLADEVYEHLTFDKDLPHTPFATVSPSAGARCRDALVASLTAAGLSPVVPDGAFFVVADGAAAGAAGRSPGGGLHPAVAALTDAAGGRVLVAPGTEGRVDYQAARQLTLGGVAAIPLSAFGGAAPAAAAADNAVDGVSSLVGSEPTGAPGEETGGAPPVPVRFAFCHPDEVLAEAGRRLAAGAAAGWSIEGGAWGKKAPAEEAA
ncbi:hypothetical protein I4F81_004071 [Pyropia yezoensis]|uniref:Uncharacterized protein n=1 Tax=Pyropia yezoensis TaxID=2788 RepID=A0ACC3BUD7_PYRYE|nr:hypothetical protein I4F81_004071 [Neopyropia yezoensis]